MKWLFMKVVPSIAKTVLRRLQAVKKTWRLYKSEPPLQVQGLVPGSFRVGLNSVQTLPKSEKVAISEEFSILYREKNSRELLSAIFSRFGVHPVIPEADEVFDSLAAYYLACLFCRLEEYEKAATYAELIEFSASVDGTDLMPFDLVESSRKARENQIAAIINDRPGTVVVSLQKSASAFLSQAVSAVYQVPILRTSVGKGPYSIVVPSWADQVAEGGAVTHEHFRPHSENLSALYNSRIKTIWVQIRDPRDAAYSSLRMVEDHEGTMYGQNRRLTDKPQLFVDSCRAMAMWIDEWLRAAENSDSELQVSIIQFEDVTRDLNGVFERVFSERFDAEAKKKLAEFQINWRRGDVLQRNFRTGKSASEWRREYGDEIVDKINAEIPDSVRSLYRF